MGLLIYENGRTPEEIEQQRHSQFLSLSAEERIFKLFRLISISKTLNGGRPLKTPQGKGIIITKQKSDGI